MQAEICARGFARQHYFSAPTGEGGAHRHCWRLLHVRGGRRDNATPKARAAALCSRARLARQPARAAVRRCPRRAERGPPGRLAGLCSAQRAAARLIRGAPQWRAASRSSTPRCARAAGAAVSRRSSARRGGRRRTLRLSLQGAACSPPRGAALVSDGAPCHQRPAACTRALVRAPEAPCSCDEGVSRRTRIWPPRQRRGPHRRPRVQGSARVPGAVVAVALVDAAQLAEAALGLRKRQLRATSRRPPLPLLLPLLCGRGCGARLTPWHRCGPWRSRSGAAARRRRHGRQSIVEAVSFLGLRSLRRRRACTQTEARRIQAGPSRHLQRRQGRKSVHGARRAAGCTLLFRRRHTEPAVRQHCPGVHVPRVAHPAEAHKALLARNSGRTACIALHRGAHRP